LAETLYLVDVNVVIARIFEAHEHHRPAVNWFDSPGLEWALCPWAEAGFLRFATRPNRLTMGEATAILDELVLHPGYHCYPSTYYWSILTKPFFSRLYGHKQITDAYLLGLAIHDGLILATFDKGIVHLAGEHSQHVYVLGAQ